MPMSDLFGVGGRQPLVQRPSWPTPTEFVSSRCSTFSRSCDREVDMLEKQVGPYFAGDLGYQAIYGHTRSRLGARCRLRGRDR